jgi:hypothetical protein
MSTRQRGNYFENAFVALAEALGYVAFPARGSRGPIDIVCFQTEKTELPPLVVQVGTGNKPVRRTLADLLTTQRPIGSLCIVARACKKKNGRRVWRFDALHGKFDSLADCIHERTRHES